MEHNNQVITIAANGHAFTAWDNQGRIFANHFDPGTQTWGDPIQISNEGTNSHPQFTTDNNNNIILIWFNAHDNRNYSARYDFNTATWGTPEISPRTLPRGSLRSGG